MTPETKERGAAVKPVGKDQIKLIMHVFMQYIYPTHTRSLTQHRIICSLFFKRKLGCFSEDLPWVKCYVGFVLFIKELSRLVENQVFLWSHEKKRCLHLLMLLKDVEEMQECVKLSDVIRYIKECNRP